MTPQLFADVRAFMRNADVGAYSACDTVGVLSAVFEHFRERHPTASFADFASCLRALHYEVAPLNYGLRKKRKT